MKQVLPRRWSLVLPRLNPFLLGFDLAAYIHDYNEAEEDVPSWFRMAWNTCNFELVTLRSWASEERWTVVPRVDATLRGVEIIPWVGRRYRLWTTDIDVTVLVRGQKATFGRRRAFGSYDQALADFNDHLQPVRWALASQRNEVTR